MRKIILSVSVISLIAIIVGIITIKTSVYLDAEKQYEQELEQVEIINSDFLFEFKERCKKVLEESGVNVEQMFVRAGDIDNREGYVYLNILTAEKEFLEFKVTATDTFALSRQITSGGGYYYRYFDTVEKITVDIESKEISIHQKEYS